MKQSKEGPVTSELTGVQQAPPSELTRNGAVGTAAVRAKEKENLVFPCGQNEAVVISDAEIGNRRGGRR